jgi:hypothetical protein
MIASTVALALIAGLALKSASGQVRSGRQATVVKGDDGKAAAAGNRGAVVKGDEGYAAVGKQGAKVKTDDGAAAVGRHGAVVAGEEGVAVAGRHGSVTVGNQYEDYEAWRAVAGVGTAIAVGTMLASPPAAATTVVVAGTTYWLHQNTYYSRVYNGGAVSYQVVAPPR